MQYTSVIIAALAATTTLAAPWQSRISTDNKLEVTLSGHGISPAKNIFHQSPATTKKPSPAGPFDTVSLRVGKGVSNQASRCKIFNEAGNAIVVQRGANTDITFADGGKGPWKFRDGPTKVSNITCSPMFLQISPTQAQTASEIRVELADSAVEFAIGSDFTPGQRQENTVGGSFTTVEVQVGDLVKKQDYRCQVLGKDGKPIVATRGANTDTTFSDAGKGAWKFVGGNVEASKVICDPAFKAAPIKST
ncbi:MAG: hypothetical protein Q9169_007153 [Polycauliona sp. 2 TL-2023]